MGNYKRVVQTGFDIAIGDNVSQEELDSLAQGLRAVINEWYDNNGKHVPIACVNGEFSFEDMSHAYGENEMKEINKLF